jgi:ribosomal 50S subunit-associated protein YjgA (DUF615 family)
MQIKFFKQLLFDCDFSIIRSKQKAVGNNHRRTSVTLQAVHNHRHKQVSRFA